MNGEKWRAISPGGVPSRLARIITLARRPKLSPSDTSPDLGLSLEFGPSLTQISSYT
ncbi:hypothetical protein A2U01_0062522, partial [Trifolium medium]|nr:hypothetical protein [Trifolium medium]